MLVAGRLTLVVNVTEGREIAYAVGTHVTHTHTAYQICPGHDTKLHPPRRSATGVRLITAFTPPWLAYSVHSISICDEWILPKAVNARNGRRQVFFGFLVVDLIPNVIAGTCSTEHKRGIENLLLISFLPTMLFTTWEPITPCEEKRSQQSWNWCGDVSVL